MSTVITAGNATNGLSLSADNVGAFEFKTGPGAGTTAMTINSSQNVGIGTTSPRLVAGYTTLGINNTTGGFTDIFAANTRVASFGADATSTYVSAVASAPLLFATNNTERMRITSGGQLLINATTYAGSGLSLTAPDGSGCYSVFSGTSGGFHWRFGNVTNGIVGGISTTTTTTTYATSSDYRLKENVQPMVGALNKISQLKPCTYNWKADSSEGEGFIAHELQAVIPDAVIGEKDAVNEDGSIKPQGIDTSFLVATLTAAIQEQQLMIQELSAKVAALEAIK